jgi:N-acylneuraminate cytidylyltransferase
MQVLAIIPARGGSVGIPRKNLHRVGGVPLVGRAVRSALDARRVTRVVVSTDDARIASCARDHGGEVIDRPADLAGPTASSESALLHALEQLRSRESYKPDIVVFIQCTTPLLTADDIDGTIERLIAQEADSALSVAPFHRYLWQRGDGGAAKGINHDSSVRKRRQDIEPQYIETGGVYAMRCDGFLAARHRFFGKIAMHVTTSDAAIEVDDPADLVVVESLVRAGRSAATAAMLPASIGALVLDFDGVFTDGRVTVDETGVESVTCSRRDGMGLTRLRERGLPILVLSKETNPVVARRCEKLRLECQHGIDDKLPALQHWAKQRQVSREALVYIGDDVNDLACLRWAGCGVTVADGHTSALAAANVTLASAGGHGAVRELCDLIEQKLEGA